jgi:predicted RNase H-like nuclease (RuvC/YqgF family)
MNGDTAVGLAVLFAVVMTITSLFYAAKRSSQGYYDDYGRKIPLDDLKNKGAAQDQEISRLRGQLEAEKQQSSGLLQKLEQLEKRIEALEKRGI